MLKDLGNIACGAKRGIPASRLSQIDIAPSSPMAKIRQEIYTVPMNDKQNIPTTTCDICEGSGQVCSFKGASRFVLTWEDCPICGGLGVIPQETDAEKTASNPQEEGKE